MATIIPPRSPYHPLSASTFIETRAKWALATWQQGILRRAEYEFQALGFWMTDVEMLSVKLGEYPAEVFRALDPFKMSSIKRELMMSEERVVISAKYLATFAFLAFPELREGE